MIEYHPLNLVCQILALARNSLASGTYLEGTFNIIRLLMLGKHKMISEYPYVRYAILDILDACEEYFKTDKSEDQHHQVELCVLELRDFIHTANDVRMSLPQNWSEIVERAFDVHNMTRVMTQSSTILGRAFDAHDMATRDMILGSTCRNSPRNSRASSRSSTLVYESDNSCSAVVLADRNAGDISDMA